MTQCRDLPGTQRPDEIPFWLPCSTRTVDVAYLRLFPKILRGFPVEKRRLAHGIHQIFDSLLHRPIALVNDTK
jgi:hypothetical protein